MRVLAPELAIALHCCAAVHALVDYRDPIVDAMVVLGVCIERLDHEPLIGMCITHLGPAHASTLVVAADIEQLLATAAGVLRELQRSTAAWQRLENDNGHRAQGLSITTECMVEAARSPNHLEQPFSTSTCPILRDKRPKWFPPIPRSLALSGSADGSVMRAQ